MEIIKANKSDKKSILRFYKAQQYSARFLGLDHCYIIKNNEKIIASVIVSYIDKSNPMGFLHALVVDKTFQHQGLASQLIKYTEKQHPTMVCFANESLTPLYLKSLFTKLPQAQYRKTLAEHLFVRFNRYQIKQPQLKVFIRQQ